jgi:hypothetical protein
MGGPDRDALAEALELIETAGREGIPIRLVGGLAVRVLCPTFPPRVRDRQDLDLASTAEARSRLTRFLVGRGYQADEQFNALYGRKQLYFASENGRAVDVLIDRMEMCHVLEFRDRIEHMPLTLDVADLLLTKLQIIELNEKDEQDILYLLSAFPVTEADEPGRIGLDRVRAIVADDWGWWKTVTLNLGRVLDLAASEGSHLIPALAPFDPIVQLQRLSSAAEDVPKSIRWRLRAKVGERKRWYQVPEETVHE